MHNILIEYGITIKLVKLMQMCLNETNTRVQVVHLADMFPIRNGLKQGDSLSPLLLNFALEYTIRRVITIHFGPCEGDGSSVCK